MMKQNYQKKISTIPGIGQYRRNEKTFVLMVLGKEMEQGSLEGNETYGDRID